MRRPKLFLAAIAATLGLAGPAAANVLPFNDSATFAPDTLNGFDFTTFTQQVQMSGPIIDTQGNGVYIGAFIDNLSSGANQIAFCDDLENDIVPSKVPYSFFASDPLHTIGANDYLSPLPQGTINDIVGLVFDATTNLGLTPQQGAAYQLAIWDLEYGKANVTASSATDLTLQADADALIGFNGSNNVAADQAFADYFASTFRYVQLELPTDCNSGAVNPSLVGQISYRATPFPGKTNCQVQGQILVVDTGIPNNLVPEPGTLALLGSGLIGLGAFRRRRRTA